MAKGNITVNLTGEPEVIEAIEHATSRIAELEAERSRMADRIRELEAVIGEPVVWAFTLRMGNGAEETHIVTKAGDVAYYRDLKHMIRERPLVFGDAPPSAAGVTITDDMVERVAYAIHTAHEEGFTKDVAIAWETCGEHWRAMCRKKARYALTAALTAAREVQPS